VEFGALGLAGFFSLVHRFDQFGVAQGKGEGVADAGAGKALGGGRVGIDHDRAFVDHDAGFGQRIGKTRDIGIERAVSGALGALGLLVPSHARGDGGDEAEPQNRADTFSEGKPSQRHQRTQDQNAGQPHENGGTNRQPGTAPRHRK
jgi:hypothetical protein